MSTAAARFAALFLVLLSLACAPAATTGGGRTDLITQEQLERGHYRNAYEAVQALHANWLITHGVDSALGPTQVAVYEDLMRVGGVDALRDINVPGIRYIQHFNSEEATARWGLGLSQGAILVSTMPR